jgi:hypothetical protein
MNEEKSLTAKMVMDALEKLSKKIPGKGSSAEEALAWMDKHAKHVKIKKAPHQYAQALEMAKNRKKKARQK